MRDGAEDHQPVDQDARGRDLEDEDCRQGRDRNQAAKNHEEHMFPGHRFNILPARPAPRSPRHTPDLLATGPRARRAASLAERRRPSSGRAPSAFHSGNTLPRADAWRLHTMPDGGRSRSFSPRRRTAARHRSREGGYPAPRSHPPIVPPDLSAQREPEEILARVQEQGFVRGLQTERLAKGGRRLTVELTSTLLRDKEGQPTRFSLVLRDVTDRHQHELALRHLSHDLAERVEARTRELASSNRELQRANAELQELDQLKSEVVSLVTHQLSAPLTNMRGAIELVRNRCATPNTTCVRMFGLLETQSARLNRLVTDILNVSRLEAGQLALQLCAVDLPQLADRVVDEIAPHHPDRRIHRPGDGREAISPPLADPDRAQEIIANLLDNALKYSPPGSPIEVRVRSTPEGINLS